MSLRDISHQAAIELRQRDTEYVTGLKDECDQIQAELRRLLYSSKLTSGGQKRLDVLRQRLARIEELLTK